MKNTIKFLAIAILINISFWAVDAQEQTIITNTESSAIKKTEPIVKKQSSNEDSWTGFYVGGFGGYTNGRANPRISTISVRGEAGGIYEKQSNVDEINTGGNQKMNSNGFTGGGTFGYNYQKGKIVVGGEVDFGTNKINKTATVTKLLNPLNPNLIYTVTQTVKSDWMMTARPRAGFVLKKALLYTTVGLAVTNIKYDGSYTEKYFSVSENGSFSKTKTGWTAGVGVEFKVANRWSVKGEYLFSQFGRTSITSTNLSYVFSGIRESKPGQVFTHSTDLKSHSIRFGR